MSYNSDVSLNIAKNEPISMNIGACYGACGPIDLIIPIRLLTDPLRRQLFDILKQLNWWGQISAPGKSAAFDIPQYKFSFMDHSISFYSSGINQLKAWSNLARWIDLVMVWAYGQKHTNIIKTGPRRYEPPSVGYYQLTL